MKQLFENWREFLNEEKIDPLDRLALYFKVGPWGGENWVQFFLYDMSIFDRVLKENPDKYDFLVAEFGVAVIGLRIRSSKPLCFNVKYEVGQSAVNSEFRGMKYGRMIYGLMMTQIYPEYVMADRNAVSTSARRMWASFDKNPKIEKVPPDKPPFIGKFDDVEADDFPKTDTKQDDCSGPDLGGDPPFLMKGYRYTSGENKALLKRLMKNHEKFVQIHSKIKIDWQECALALFAEEYD